MTDFTGKAIILLATGFADQFKDYVLENEHYQELMMKLADKFVSDNIPIVKPEDATDVACELVQSVAIALKE